MFDWRQHGAVTGVQNQGALGCVTNFAAADAISSLHEIKTGKLESFSVGELRDCCPECCHGLLGSCLPCITSLRLCTTEEYPNYPPSSDCVNKTRTCSFHIKGWKYVPRGNESALAYAVLTNPVVTAVDASQTSFQVRTCIIVLPGTVERISHGHLVAQMGILSS